MRRTGGLARMLEPGSAIRTRIEQRDLFYTPHEAGVLNEICIQWKAQRGKARGPLRDAMGGCFVIWKGGTEKRRAHVCHHEGKGPTDNSDRTRDGAHEWVQQCLFRLGRLNGFDPKVEVKFDMGYRADVLWRRALGSRLPPSAPSRLPGRSSSSTHRPPGNGRPRLWALQRRAPGRAGWGHAPRAERLARSNPTPGASRRGPTARRADCARSAPRAQSYSGFSTATSFWPART